MPDRLHRAQTQKQDPDAYPRSEPGQLDAPMTTKIRCTESIPSGFSVLLRNGPSSSEQDMVLRACSRFRLGCRSSMGFTFRACSSRCDSEHAIRASDIPHLASFRGIMSQSERPDLLSDGCNQLISFSNLSPLISTCNLLLARHHGILPSRVHMGRDTSHG